MRKMIALFLALVLSFSLLTVAGATDVSDYTDLDEINHVEAIDVLSALNILEGSGGSFHPKSNVNRAEAAAIVARLAMTRTAADSLTTTKTRFADLQNYQWATKYIETCANMGIINGMGGNKYDPAGNVTGYQFAKMLLTAVGYGQRGEYVGSSWIMNVAKDAHAVGLFAGTTAKSMNDPATREECALYAFNVLTGVDMVNYSPLLNAYTSTGLVGTEAGTTLGEKQYGLGYAVTSELTAPNSRGQYSIGKVKMTGDLVDAIGRSVKVWYVSDRFGNATAISDAYYTDIVLGENHFGYSYAAMTNPKHEGFIAKAEKASKMVVYINGSCSDDFGIPYTVSDVGNKKGVLVSFVDTAVNGIFDGVADKVFVLEKNAAQLSADPTIRTIAGTESILIPGVTSGFVETDSVEGYETLKYGDVVLYWTDCLGILHIEEADSFTGQLTGSKSLTTGMGYVIDEQVYRLSDLTGAAELTNSMYDIAMSPSASYRDYTYYVDNGGYIIAAVPVDGELSGYVVIAEIEAVEPVGVDSVAYAEALLVNMEGKKTVARLSSVILNADDSDFDGVTDYSVRYAGRGTEFNHLIDTSLGRGKYVINGDITALVGNTFFTYSESDGVYTLSSVYAKTVNRIETEIGSLTDISGYDIRNGKAAFASGLTGNADTKFIVYNKSTNKYDLFEGISKVPNIELADAGETGYVAVNGFTKYVFVGKNAIESTSAISQDTAFILSTTPIRDWYNSDTHRGYGIYSAIVDGQLSQVMIKMSASEVRSLGVGYKTVFYDGDYIVDMSNNDTLGLAPQDGYAVSVNSIRLAASSAYSYSFSETAPAFIVDSNRSAAVAETTISALSSDRNDTVFVVIPSASSSVASYIVVYENDPSADIAITTQPLSATYDVGDEPAALTVSAVASDNQTGYLTYQWYKGEDSDIRHAEKIPGATAPILAQENISTDADGVAYYFVIVTHDRTGMQVTSVVSDPAVITVHGEVSAPVIGSITPNTEITFGTSELPTLRVETEAPDQGTLSCQWLKDGVAIEGATSASLILTDLVDTSVLGTTKFQVKITHHIDGNPNIGVTTSEEISVTVVPADSSVTVSDDSMAVNNDVDIIYSAVLSEAVTGTANYVLEWIGASGWTELATGTQELNNVSGLLYPFTAVYTTSGNYRVRVEIEIAGHNPIESVYTAHVEAVVSDPGTTPDPTT